MPKTTEILDSRSCNNLAELITALDRISKDALTSVPDYYVTINDGVVIVKLTRSTLTDGSEVYNLNIE